MKKNILYSLVGLAVLFGMSACSEDRYETSVVKQIELFLNDDEWFVNVGINTKPLFIYNAGMRRVCGELYFSLSFSVGEWHL